MWAYVTRRLLWLPFMLFFVSLVTFTLGRFGPGDPVEVMLGARYEPEVADRMRESLGLNRPFFIQYADYLWGTLHGDFGESFRYRGRSVGSLIAPKIWVSFQVNMVAMVVSVGIGIPMGFWIAHRQGTWLDPTAVTVFLIFMSAPIMVSIPLVLWGLCLKMSLVPCAGWGGLWDLRIIIPAITMGLPGVAILARLMRASTLDVMGQDFIRTARAKGLNEITISSRHIFRNAMIPMVTIFAFSLAGMLTTSFITERLLGIPGVGNLVIESVWQRDYPVIMAVTLIGACAFVVANLLADIAYTVIDPRIRYR